MGRCFIVHMLAQTHTLKAAEKPAARHAMCVCVNQGSSGGCAACVCVCVMLISIRKVIAQLYNETN